MTEPQVWAVIGVLAATFVGFATMIVAVLLRMISTQFNGLRGEMNARFEAIDTRFEAMGDRLDDRFGHIARRIDALDHDVQALARRVFHNDP